MRTMVRGMCGVNPRTKAPQIVITTDSVDSERDRHLVERSRVRIPLRVMVSHDYHELPVGQVDRRDQIVTRGGKMVAEFRWFEGDERAARVKNIFQQGGLDASVGVADVEHVPNEYGGINFWGEVIEFSLTPIPANRECIAIVRSVLAERAAAPGGFATMAEFLTRTTACDAAGRPRDDDLIHLDLDELLGPVTIALDDLREAVREQAYWQRRRDNLAGYAHAEAVVANLRRGGRR